VLAEGEPSPRVAALAALISASGTLPQFDREIPWTSPVITRAKEVEQGNLGAGAAAEAVARTFTALIVSNVIIAATVHPRSSGTPSIDLATARRCLFAQAPPGPLQGSAGRSGAAEHSREHRADDPGSLSRGHRAAALVSLAGEDLSCPRSAPGLIEH